MGEHAVPVDPANAEQLRAWDGREGGYWASRGDRFDEGVANYHHQFLDAAGIEAGSRVLDIGCGNGQTTRDAARRAGAGSALGVDLSTQMIERARELARAQGVPNVTFRQADAQIHPFDEASIDVAISRSGAMFFGDPLAAFGNIARAIAPGGRLTLLTWQPLARNEWVSSFRGALAAGRELPAPAPDAPGPFSLSDPDRVRALLGSAGFTDVTLRGLTERMYFGRDTEDAFGFISGQFGWMLEQLPGEARTRALEALRANLSAHQTEQGVCYDSAAWLIQARR